MSLKRHIINVGVTRQVFSCSDEIKRSAMWSEKGGGERERKRETVKGLNIVELRWRSLFRLALDADREKSWRQTHKDAEEKQEREEEEEEEDARPRRRRISKRKRSGRDLARHGASRRLASFPSFLFIVSSSFCCLSLAPYPFFFSSSLICPQILIGYARSDLLSQSALTITMDGISCR